MLGALAIGGLLLLVVLCAAGARRLEADEDALARALSRSGCDDGNTRVTVRRKRAAATGDARTAVHDAGGGPTR